MKIKLNKKKLKQKGFDFEGESMLFDSIKQKIEWLKSHNKNYTKAQYFVIDELSEIFSCCESSKLNNLTPPHQKQQNLDKGVKKC